MGLSTPDVTVIGSGPNGMAAAIELARAGRAVRVVEGAETAGGGVRSSELTLPGFVHDVCSAVYPLVPASPFFRTVPLASLGVALVEPDVPLAHPLDDGTAVVLERSVAATAAGLGRDAWAYERLMRRFVAESEALAEDVLAPLRIPPHPVLLARFGLLGIGSAAGLARALFVGQRARALFAGLAAHSMLPLTRPPSAAIGLVLGIYAHAVGWPFVRGGSQVLADALAAHLRSLGGEIVTGCRVDSLDDVAAGVVVADVTPRQLLDLAGERLRGLYRRQLERFRYGPGVFKVDWALDGPIPWRAPECGRAGTVHLGGTLDEIAEAETAAAAGRHAERPFVLLTQPSLFDPTRAPQGKQTAWAYCHVPGGSDVDITDRIEAQVERFAPGFRERILARHVMPPSALEQHNPNDVGGDINGGIQDLRQLFTRPAVRLDPYSTPLPSLFICSSSTPPGGGVHGMCGHYAARSVLRRGR